MSPPIILASGSPRRRELLARLGLPFTVVASGIDEVLDESLPIAEAVARLATRKAASVADEIDQGLVIGADTVVVRDDVVLGKPGDAENAVRMLRLLRDRWHDVYTGVAIVDAATRRTESNAIRTRVRMRPYGDEEIAAYVATGEPLDRAGAYAVQERGGSLVERVDGCYFNVVGLPLCEVSGLLAWFNVAGTATVPVCRLPTGEPCPRLAMPSNSCAATRDSRPTSVPRPADREVRG